jgi:hypothetical protein
VFTDAAPDEGTVGEAAWLTAWRADERVRL